MTLAPATEDATALLEPGPVLLYDGECGVCATSVQWVLARERRHTLRFAALQSAAGRTLRSAASVDPEVDSLLWVEQREGRVQARVYSSAVVEVARYVGAGWALLGRLLWLVPRPLRDGAYRLFARRRHSVIARQCLLPTPEQRARFLGSPVGSSTN